MIEILRDSIWQFIGAAIAIIAIVASFIIYFFQRSKKSLVYKVLYDTQLFTKSEDIARDFKIYFKDQPITNAGLVFLEIINNGNQPIATADFEKPLKFVFDEEVRLLSAEVVATYPENLEINLSVEKNILFLAPALLNSRDHITVKLLLDGDKTKIKVDTRIIGVSKVERVQVNQSMSKIDWFVVIFMIGMCISLTIPQLKSVSLILLNLGFIGIIMYFTYRKYISDLERVSGGASTNVIKLKDGK